MSGRPETSLLRNFFVGRDIARADMAGDAAGDTDIFSSKLLPLPSFVVDRAKSISSSALRLRLLIVDGK